MAAKKVSGRQSWLDDQANTPVISEYAQKLDTFLAAVADGVISDSELNDQEKRVTDLMKSIEPQLDDALHAQVTQLLCELTAYDIMQMMHSMQQARGQVTFQG